MLWSHVKATAVCQLRISCCAVATSLKYKRLHVNLSVKDALHSNDCDSRPISQLTNLFIRIQRIYKFCLVVDRMGVFFYAMLPSVKFAEEKVLFFFILREKC